MLRIIVKYDGSLGCPPGQNTNTIHIGGESIKEWEVPEEWAKLIRWGEAHVMEIVADKEHLKFLEKVFPVLCGEGTGKMKVWEGVEARRIYFNEVAHWERQ